MEEKGEASEGKDGREKKMGWREQLSRSEAGRKQKCSNIFTSGDRRPCYNVLFSLDFNNKRQPGYGTCELRTVADPEFDGGGFSLLPPLHCLNSSPHPLHHAPIR